VSRVIESIFALPWWGALAVLVALLMASTELGFRLGRAGMGAAGKPPGQAAVALAGLLGLLGLLLGFSFGMAESRYSVRKALVLEEANAIGTTYLRARFLPDEQRERVRSMLREYVDLRLRPVTPAALEEGIERSGKLHVDLWREAELAGRAHPTSEVVGLFVRALNELIDLHTSRVSIGLHQRLPAGTFSLLLTVSIVVSFMFGYTTGLGKAREVVPTAALVVSVAAVIVMIDALDAPAAPMFRITQWSMEDVRRSMAEN